jgi:hypothetical protein
MKNFKISDSEFLHALRSLMFFMGFDHFHNFYNDSHNWISHYVKKNITRGDRGEYNTYSQYKFRFK